MVRSIQKSNCAYPYQRQREKKKKCAYWTRYTLAWAAVDTLHAVVFHVLA